MKHLLLFCTFLAVGTAGAQTLGPKVKVGLHGTVATVSIPEPLNEVYGTGYGGGVHLDVKFLVASVRVSGDFMTFSADNDKFRAAVAPYVGAIPAGVTFEAGRVNVLATSVNGKYVVIPLPIVSPYVTGGVGLASVSVGEGKVLLNGVPVAGASIPAVKGETKASVNIGAGVDLDFGDISLLVEARYTWIFSEGDKVKYLPISFGVTF